MDVRLVDFPATRVAAIEHRGPVHLEYETARKLIAWRIANRLSPERPGKPAFLTLSISPRADRRQGETASTTSLWR